VRTPPSQFSSCVKNNLKVGFPVKYVSIVGSQVDEEKAKLESLRSRIRALTLFKRKFERRWHLDPEGMWPATIRVPWFDACAEVKIMHIIVA
jgi:hypothetical protein